MFLVLVFVAHHMNGVGKAVATLADGPGTTVPAVPITGQFSCQSSSHTYLLTTRSASGTLRIVDAQTPRGVEEAVPGGSGFVDDLTSGETVALSVETSAQGPWSPPSTLMAPDQAC